jgi:hypothetical protein
VNELRSLINHRDSLCTTLILDSRNTEGSFDELVETAAAESRALTSKSTHKQIFSQLKSQPLRAKLRQPPRGFASVMVFQSSEVSAVHWLDRPLKTRAVLDDTFFVQPLTPSLQKKDTVHLVWLEPELLLLESVSWTGEERQVKAQQPWDGGRKILAQLMHIQRLINQSRRPWVLAGSLSMVQSDCARIFQARLKKPLATIVQSDLSRARNSARQISRLHQESIGVSLATRLTQLRPPDRIWTNLTAIQDSMAIRAADTLVIEQSLVTGEATGAGATLTRQTAPEHLLVDDLVEMALDRSMAIIEVPNLKEKIGVHAASLRLKVEQEEKWIN